MSKIKLVNNIKIYNDEYLLKEEKDLTEIYKYLDSKKFYNYANLLEVNNNINKYKYIDNIKYNDADACLSGIKVLADLHKKTSHNKEVNIDKVNEIYCYLKSYIDYILDKYTSLVNNILLIEYPFSSDLLLINNFYKIKEMCNKSKELLEAWYRNAYADVNKRFVLNHGNLELEHILINDKTYFISWNKSKFDSPVLDLIIFYKNVWDVCEFDTLFKEYLSVFDLTDNERNLFFINICIPYLFEESKSEFIRTKNVSTMLKYLYKVDKLIRNNQTNK